MSRSLCGTLSGVSQNFWRTLLHYTGDLSSTGWQISCIIYCHFRLSRADWILFLFLQQEGSLCAQHCLNTLLQESYFTAVDLADIGHQLDESERQQMAVAGMHSDDYQKFLEVSFHQYAGLNIKGCPTCPPRYNIGQDRYIMKFTFGWAGEISNSRAGEPKN